MYDSMYFFEFNVLIKVFKSLLTQTLTQAFMERNSLISSLSLRVKGVEEDIQLLGDRVNTTRGWTLE